jgi:ribosomal protein S18 acetylase RimI-like enzyme
VTAVARTVADEADPRRMAALVHAFPADHLHVVDLPWRLTSPALETPANTRLWEDERGNLIGWAIWNQPFAVFDYALAPTAGAAGLEDHILAWAVKRGRAVGRQRGERLPYWVEVRADDAARRARLAAHGFTERDWSAAPMACDLTRPRPAPAAPAGFTIRPLAGVGEVAAYVDLHRLVFGGPAMTVAWRERTLRHADYHPALDLVAVDAGGRLVGFCVGWLLRHDPANGGRAEGQIEPLGVHPDARRRGLGRALLLEGLRRFQEHGAAMARVETDAHRSPARRLYASVGFRAVGAILKYAQDF